MKFVFKETLSIFKFGKPKIFSHDCCMFRQYYKVIVLKYITLVRVFI